MSFKVGDLITYNGNVIKATPKIVNAQGKLYRLPWVKVKKTK